MSAALSRSPKAEEAPVPGATRADLDDPGFSLPEPPAKVPGMRVGFVPPFAERRPTMHP